MSNGAVQTRNLGIPVEVDVAVIEQELRALWKSASRREEESAVIRACSCNLITIVGDQNEAAQVIPVVAGIAEYHPCRAIIAYAVDRPRASEGPAMRAWISAQCSVPRAGGPQICSEVVTLEGNTGSPGDLLSALLPLVVPDLQFVLYRRSTAAEEGALSEILARDADLLIVDSHRAKDADTRTSLVSSLLDARPGLAVRDLNWSRITLWRELVAEFFDSPESCGDWSRISEVLLSQSVDDQERMPTRSMLLAGWLASRLGWENRRTCLAGGTWESVWRSESGDVHIRLRSTPALPGSPAGIDRLEIGTSAGNSYVIVRDAGSGCVLSSADAGGRQTTHAVPEEKLGEASLLIRELSISGQDASFREALAAAFKLEQSFSNRSEVR